MKDSDIAAATFDLKNFCSDGDFGGQGRRHSLGLFLIPAVEYDADFRGSLFSDISSDRMLFPFGLQILGDLGDEKFISLNALFSK